MDNLILAVVLLAILGMAITYIIKEKKRGVKCIGCPAAAECASRQDGAPFCSGNCNGCSGCGAKDEGGCHGHAEEK